MHPQCHRGARRGPGNRHEAHLVLLVHLGHHDLARLVRRGHRAPTAQPWTAFESVTGEPPYQLAMAGFRRGAAQDDPAPLPAARRAPNRGADHPEPGLDRAHVHDHRIAGRHARHRGAARDDHWRCSTKTGY